MSTRNHTSISTIFRQFLISIAMLNPLVTQASESIQTDLLNTFIFDTEVEAVKAMKGLCLAESQRENAEHMGAILQTGEGRFLVTHGKAAPEQESVTFSIRRPASSRLVALWHTHGAPGRQTERFSIEDGQTVRETGMRFYLITPKGEIKVLEKDVKGLSRSEWGKSNTTTRKFVRKFRGLALFRLT